MSQLSTLDELGVKHGTDKASFYHNYLNFYETFFAPLRHETLTLLEIGVFQGASLKTWEAYFPNAKIVGADIMPVAKRFAQNRVTIELADQSNVEQLTQLALKHGPFDIIIEDGSHMWEHQTTSLRTLFPFLKNGGLFIVEDLQTNYGSMQAKYQGVATETCVDYLKKLVDLRVGDDQIDIAAIEDPFLRTYGRAVQFITFYRRACLLKKYVPPVAWGIDPGQPLTSEGLDPNRLPVLVTAHVSNLGDIFGATSFVNLGETFPLQGLAINVEDDAIESRVRFADDTWSAWTPAGTFAGTRGQSMVITGFTLRLVASLKKRYKLDAFGRFAGTEKIVRVSEGQDCLSAAGEALCGMQIELVKRG